MKRILKYKVFTILTFVLIVATSCLNDDEHYTDFSTVSPQIEFPEVANASSGMITRAMVFSENFVDVIVKVNLASPNVLNEDVTVTLAYDPSVLAAMNASMKANDENYVDVPIIPSENLQLPTNMTVVIPAGKRLVDFTFKVKPNDPVNVYGIPFKIASVSPSYLIIPSNFKTTIVSILAKNVYDGVYAVTANSPMVDVLNSAFTGYYPFDYSLETVGANSVLCKDITVWDDYMHPMRNAGATSGYGSFGLQLIFDPSGNGNIIDIKNPWGNPPANTRMPKLDPSGVNKWDPATKTIKIKYWMLQPSLVPDAPNIRVYFDETWTYVKSR